MIVIVRGGWATDEKEKNDKLSTVIQMMSEVMNKLMEVEKALKDNVDVSVVKGKWMRESIWLHTVVMAERRLMKG